MSNEICDARNPKYDELENTIKQGKAFGSGAVRFGKFFGHPKLNTSRSLNDPVQYSPTYNHRKCNTYLQGREPWTYQNELQDWSRNLGYRNQEVLIRRKEEKRWLGPAWHTVPNYSKYEPACNNVGFGRTSRFLNKLKDCFPGPGTYYKANPYKAPYGPHSTRPTFEREHPCRFRNTVPSWYRGISNNDIVDKDSIQMKPKKLVSRRGPYDLFTGKRNETTIISKLNFKKVSAATWPYLLPGSFDTYKKSHFGEFPKHAKDAPFFGRNALVDISLRKQHPDDPSPAHYTPNPEKKVTEGKVAFLSSDFKVYNYDKSKLIFPSVGRYNIDVSSNIAGAGHTHVFKSKVPRALFDGPEILNSF